MSGRALLLVAPAAPSAVAPESPLLGLPMIRRTVLAAERAGFGRIAIAGAARESPLALALAGTRAELLPAGGPPPQDAVVVPWNLVLRTAEVKEIASGRGPAGLGVAVSSAEDRRVAERWLLDGLVKDSEGFMSRHFERKVSLEVSRRLAGTAITPNAMTLVSVAIGLAGAPFFLSAQAPMQTAGALLFLLHSILDGCDGELARLKFQESRFGGVLDFWGDNVVHSAIFAAIAVGWSRAIGAAWPLWLGAAAVAGTAASASSMPGLCAGPSPAPLFTGVVTSDTAVSRVADALSRRDFIYLVLLLSLFGKAAWFLALTAAGAPIFFLVLVLLDRQRPERKTI